MIEFIKRYVGYLIVAILFVLLGFMIGKGSLDNQGAALYRFKDVKQTSLNNVGTNDIKTMLFWTEMNGKWGCYYFFLNKNNVWDQVKTSFSAKDCHNVFPSSGATGAINKGKGFYTVDDGKNVTDNYNNSCNVKFSDGTTAKGTSVYNQMNLFVGCDTLSSPNVLAPTKTQVPVVNTKTGGAVQKIQ